METAFVDRTYRNLIAEIGLGDAEVDARIRSAWNTLFYGKKEERIFFPVGDELGYILDTGNDDARTEGMSYGMMMAVQMDDKDVFDRIWRWTVRYMQHREGKYRHYFAWSVNPDGTRRAEGPAPDGEEYFALALFFASHRWGDGEAPTDYSNQARTLLHACVHKGENGEGDPMWDASTKLIKFTPESPWTDASYHLPHFYDLFALWADEADHVFWRDAAKASRAYLHRACHPVTGLAPEYGNFDGSPHRAQWDYGHHHFYSDSYRVAANIGLDYAWFAADGGQKDLADKIQLFFADKECEDLRMYTVEGQALEEPALHPEGLIATVAQASLATSGLRATAAARRLWNRPLRKGKRRYYDNCLQFFALLALAGRYRIW
jgi:oligosaccharide reducing-end xylanase